MPFEDLTEPQKSFIQKYFKTKAFNSKEKNLALNEDFEKAASAVYREINRIKALIDDIATKHEHAPISQYESRLDHVTNLMEQTLKDNKKSIKKGIVPDFGPVTTSLSTLDMAIKARLDQVERGAGIDGKTAEKEKSAEAKDSELRTHERAAEDLFRDAMRHMQISPKADLTARNAAMDGYRGAKSTANDELLKIVERDAPAPSVSLEAFNASLTKVYDDFLTAAAPHLDTINNLLAKPAIDPNAAFDAYALKPEFTELETVKRADVRTDAAKATKEKIDGFVIAQTDKLDALKVEFKNAKTKEDKAKARAAFEAKEAQLRVLKMRQDQLRKFEENETSRKKALVEAVMTVEASNSLAISINTQIDETPIKLIPELQELVFARQETLISQLVVPDLEKITEKIAQLREDIEAATKTEMILPKLDSAEAPVMQLESHEAGALRELLKLAEACVTDNAPEHALALLDKVRSDKAAYMRARTALALPPSEPPEPSDTNKIYDRINFYEAELRDKIALSVPGATEKLTELLALETSLKTAKNNDDYANLTPFDNQLKHIINAINDLPLPPPLSDEFVQAKAKTDETRMEVAGILDSLLRTEKVTDKDIIEVPNREYSKSEQANLVRSDEIITVEISPGVFEQHKILQHRKGKGGEDLARREDKKIPREASDALRQKAEALRFMSESESSDCAQAMEKYREEVETFATDIRDHGDDLYPKVEAILKTCDGLFKKGTVSKFLPTDFGKVKAPYDSFKEGWKSQGPTTAFENAEKHRDLITILEADAVRVKALYDMCKDSYKKIIADLSGKKNKSDDANPLGKMVKAALKQSPEDFFAKAEHLGDKALYDKLQKAKKDFEKLIAWYAKNPDVAKNELCGDWMTKAENAYKKLDSHEEGNIKEAEGDLSGIRAEMISFDDRMDGISNAKGPDVAKLLVELTDLMMASAEDVVKRHNEKAAFIRADKALIEKITAAVKAGAKKSKNPIAKDILDRLGAVNKQRKALVSTSDADEAYRAGLATMEGYDSEADDLIERLGETDAQKKEKIKTMRIGKKTEVLESMVASMSERAKKLAPDTISKFVPDPDPTGIGANVTIVGANLDKVSQLPSLDALKTLGLSIDKLNDDATNGASTKADRIKEREKALAQIRKFRSSFDAHPAVKLYRDNPFDMGTDVRLVQTALHQVEIAFLASVSPREAS
ncbi:MAG: hypothetical protein ABJL99_03875 [Aliishimia sp.]